MAVQRTRIDVLTLTHSPGMGTGFLPDIGWMFGGIGQCWEMFVSYGDGNPLAEKRATIVEYALD